MIDITTVRTFDMPPDTKTLANENVRLIVENDKLSNQTKFIIGMVVFAVAILGIIISTSKKDNDEKQ